MWKALLVALRLFGPADLRQIDCLADTIFFETRGSSTLGMLAVADVVMNRVRDSRFPNTVCKVVYQRGQFEWTRRHYSPSVKKRERDVYEKSKAIAMLKYAGLVGLQFRGALYFFNPLKVRPAWAKHKRVLGFAGGHKFLGEPDV